MKYTSLFLLIYLFNLYFISHYFLSFDEEFNSSLSVFYLIFLIFLSFYNSFKSLFLKLKKICNKILLNKKELLFNNILNQKSFFNIILNNLNTIWLFFLHTEKKSKKKLNIKKKFFLKFIKKINKKITIFSSLKSEKNLLQLNNWIFFTLLVRNALKYSYLYYVIIVYPSWWLNKKKECHS